MHLSYAHCVYLLARSVAHNLVFFDHCSHSLCGCLTFDQVAFMHIIHIILDRVVLVLILCFHTCFQL